MTATARVAKAEISFAQGLFDIDFMLKGGGSAHAELTMDDGTVESFGWYHDEISYAAADFVGKTMTEIAHMHYERDMAYLRS